MDFQTKQTQQELKQNYVAVEKKLLPAKLSGAPLNLTAIIAWLGKNAMVTNGILDASVANIFSAVQALHKASMLDWSVAPAAAPKDQPAFQDSRQENRPLSETAADNLRISIIENEEAKRLRGVLDIEKSAQLQEAVDFVKNWSGGISHSQKSKQREALKATFDANVGKLSPKALLAVLKKRTETFDTSTSWGI
jgi:hypothetical protein